MPSLTPPDISALNINDQAIRHAAHGMIETVRCCGARAAYGYYLHLVSCDCSFGLVHFKQCYACEA